MHDSLSQPEIRPNSLATDGWRVVLTQPQKEQFARDNLERQAFSTFFPQFFRRRRHARRTDTILAPLFPSYLFVKAEGPFAPRLVNATAGVRACIGSERGKASIMPAAAMAALFARCRDNIVERLFEPSTGSQVRVMRGPLAERMATVEALDARGRVRLLIELLGRDVSIELEQSAIGPA